MSSSLWPFSSTDCAIASDREAIGETVFIISCVSTRMSLVQESCSWACRCFSKMVRMRFSVRLNLFLSWKRKFNSPSSSASIIYATFLMSFRRVWTDASTAAMTATMTTSNMI